MATSFVLGSGRLPLVLLLRACDGNDSLGIGIGSQDRDLTPPASARRQRSRNQDRTDIIIFGDYPGQMAQAYGLIVGVSEVVRVGVPVSVSSIGRASSVGEASVIMRKGAVMIDRSYQRWCCAILDTQVVRAST